MWRCEIEIIPLMGNMIISQGILGHYFRTTIIYVRSLKNEDCMYIIHVHVHVHVHIHIHIHAYIHIHAHAHAHTNTHTHTCIHR